MNIETSRIGSNIGGPPKWMTAIASVLSLVGFVDSIYLTVHHYTAEPVPCSVTNGCEMVLSSAYAEILGIPLAAFGGLAYFLAFSLAIFTIFGKQRTWSIFGIQSAVMAVVSGWLIYVQAFLIGAFCQFCLLSAATSISLFTVFVASRFFRSEDLRMGN